MSASSKTVLITGCSSGIGHETALHLAGKGWTVYATARRPEAIADLAERGCKTLALDVTDEASMQAAVSAVEDGCGRHRSTDQQRRLRPVGGHRERGPGLGAAPVRDERVWPRPDVAARPAGAYEGGGLSRLRGGPGAVAQKIEDAIMRHEVPHARRRARPGGLSRSRVRTAE